MTLVIEAKAATDQAERRRSQRHILCLDAEAAVGDKLLSVQLHELSRSGFLMECQDPFAVGEQFEIELAGSGSHRARTIWSCGSLVGCEFQTGLTASVCSAALLKANPKKQAETPMWWIDDDAGDTDAATETAAQPGVGRDVRWVVSLSIALWVTLAVTAAILLA